MARERRRQRSAHFAWFITVPLAVLAVSLMTIAGQRSHDVLSPLPISCVFFVLFLASEATNLKIEVRRHGIQLSVIEIPLLLGLFYLTPLTVFSVRMLGDDIVHAPRAWPTSPEFPGLGGELPAGAPMDNPRFPVLWQG